MRTVMSLVVNSVLSISLVATAYADQSELIINTEIRGPVLSFDWPELEIGVGSYEAGPTGLTIFRFRNQASVVVDVRGGSPGTTNTDVLRLGYDRPAFTDAIVFSGGALYGEETITAVATALKDDRIRSGRWDNIAFVPGAVIFDFGERRPNEIYPDKRLAQAAWRALRTGVFPLGAQGAGRMAMQGGFFGCDAHSGQGGAFRQIGWSGKTKIAAFVVVNAWGAVTDRTGQLVRCDRGRSWTTSTNVSDLLRNLPDSLDEYWKPTEAKEKSGAATTKNTTISLVVTNRKMSFWELQRMATQVHTSMGRAIQPFATDNDGDTLFAASTQEIEDKSLDSATFGAIAAETMWDAILASVPDEPQFVPPSTPIVLDPDTLARYAGMYAFGQTATLRVRIENGELLVQLKEGDVHGLSYNPTVFIPKSESEFYVDKRHPTRIAFTSDASGKVIGMTINPGLWELTGSRVPE